MTTQLPHACRGCGLVLPEGTDPDQRLCAKCLAGPPPSYFERVVAMSVALANVSPGRSVSECVAEARRILDSEVES